MRHVGFVLFLAFLAFPTVSTPVAAQGDACGVCILYPIAGLHRAALQGSPVQNGHDELVDGTCGEWHGHTPCDVTEDEATLVATLRSGASAEAAVVQAFVDRHADRVTFVAEQTGFYLKSCDADSEATFVPLSPRLWIELVDPHFHSNSP